MSPDPVQGETQETERATTVESAAVVAVLLPDASDKDTTEFGERVVPYLSRAVIVKEAASPAVRGDAGEAIVQSSDTIGGCTTKTFVESMEPDIGSPSISMSCNSAEWCPLCAV